MKGWKYSVFAILMVIICLTAVKSQPQSVASANDTTNTKKYVFESKDTLIIYDSYLNMTNQTDIEKAKNVVHIKFEGDVFLPGRIPECPNLQYLTIGKNTTKIVLWHYDSNRYEFKNLKEINVDTANAVYESYQGALYTKGLRELLYYPMSGTTNAVIPAATRIITSFSCNGVPITSIKLQEGLITIETGALSNTKLKEISLPGSFRTIEQEAFLNSPLVKVTVADNNKSLCSIDGVVYSKDRSYLYYWPEEKAVEKLELPDTLKFLDCNMISHFDQITYLKIPKALTAITNTSENQLAQVTLSAENKYFSLYDGALYSNDQTRLWLYPNQNEDHEIILSSKLTELPMNLFNSENTTTSLTLPDNLVRLDGSESYNKVMLGGFMHLSELKISNQNPNFTIENGVMYNKAKTSLLWYPIDLSAKQFTIPETVTKIENDQLVRQNHLEEITISSKCMVYDMDQLNNEYLQTYEMPFGRECPKLTKFTVKAKNPYYTCVDGILFSKDKTILYGYPSAKKDTSYEIPETVVSAAFGNSNPYLQTLIVSKNVQNLAVPEIYEYAVYISDGLLGFSALKEIRVSSLNPYLESIDGVVYMKSSNYLNLLVYPAGKTASEFYLPKETAVITGTQYFEHHGSLKKIYVDSASKQNKIIDGTLWLNYQEYNDLNLDGIELVSK